MLPKTIVSAALLLLVLGFFAATLSAQQVELYPNVGFFWPRHVDIGDARAHMKDEGMYGLKGGVFFNPNIQLEGSFGYINHFESRLVPTALDQTFGIMPRTIYGLLYDVNGVWNFGNRQFFGNRFSPYAVGGLGGLTAQVRHGTSALIAGHFYTTDPTTGAAVLDNSRTITLNDGASFLSINYGGGVKATNLWGPMGFRVDVRGRTFPNFRGRGMTWPEATAGLTFTFGER